MIVYRICRAKYTDFLSGEGARLSGGRWNSVGTPMIYTSGSRALCILELWANYGSDLVPKDFVWVEMEIPKTLKIDRVLLTKAPPDWQSFPHPNSTKEIGDQFVLGNKKLVLEVPSSLVPQEHNFLINPTHLDVKKIKILKSEPLQMDLRLIQ